MNNINCTKNEHRSSNMQTFSEHITMHIVRESKTFSKRNKLNYSQKCKVKVKGQVRH